VFFKVPYDQKVSTQCVTPHKYFSQRKTISFNNFFHFLYAYFPVYEYKIYEYLDLLPLFVIVIMRPLINRPVQTCDL